MEVSNTHRAIRTSQGYVFVFFSSNDGNNLDIFYSREEELQKDIEARAMTEMRHIML